ncbi:MAG TPA: VOC family protein [Stenomitos sp.]
MAETVTHAPGKFVWRELFTPDVEASKRFYGGLFGWNWSTMPMGEGMSTYTMAMVGDQTIAGFMDLAHLPEGDPVPPHWSVYVYVDDVDQALERAIAAGGRACSDATDIPGVGRFAVVRDPQGAMFNLFRATQGGGEAREPGFGEFHWEHLNTSDPEAAIAFYTQVVGWGTESFGPVSFFTREDGTEQVGVVSQAPAGVPAHWITYVRVADLAATNAKAKELGAEVIEERIDVPGRGAFALLKDPFGVLFMTSELA